MASETGEYRSMTLRDPRGGRRSWSLTLPGSESGRALAVVGSGSGPRTVLATEGTPCCAPVRGRCPIPCPAHRPGPPPP
ncbi:hypothetical protein DN402_16490 [Streptomyces sp. SW4]|nr:hypothetical protein DN402_16490 [Streptomyces sp. SW4]